MNKKYIYALPALAVVMASCAEGYEGDFKMDKPESVVQAEHLASLSTLKSAVDRTANPNFKLGIAVSSADYISRGVTYSIALTNFDMVTDLNAMAYSAIMDENGAYSLNAVADMVLADSPRVAGGSMLCYNALPVAWLEEVVSPTFIKGDLASGGVSVADFDADAQGQTYEMNNGSVATVTADPAGGEGNVLQIGSSDNKARNSYAYLRASLPDGLTVGDIVSVGFDLYCPDANSQKKNFVAIVNGVRKNFTGDTPDKRGCPLDTWSRKLTLDISDMAFSEEESASTELILCLGPNVNNSYYFIDNVTFTWETGEPDKYVEKNEAEKAQALADNFSDWASAVMGAYAPGISDYVVLSNPMSDVAPYSLRTSESESEAGNDIAGEFFFNDYMGDNFLKTVTDCLSKAYAAAEGVGTPVFYVSESGLLGNPDKTNSFLSQVSSWSAAGAKIDGIAISLGRIDATDENRSAITNLFQTLSASGKLVRLDNLAVTDADAEFYSFLISEYFRLIKAENRAGIIFAGVSDLWKNYSRTEAYEAVFNALSAN